MKLSKREIILLAVLFIIAIVFLEARFLINPGIQKIANLQMEMVDLEAEYQAASFQIASIDNLTEKRNQSLDEIETYSEPFLGSVQTDALLFYTHKMMLSHGFVVYSYTPSALDTVLIQPDQAAITQLNYQLKEIARQYQSLDPDVMTDQENNTVSNEQVTGEEYVEHYSVRVRAKGSYAQVKALLDEYKQLGKTIIFSNLSLSPTQGAVGILDVELTVEYFGIFKLVKDSDPLNTWDRDPIAFTDLDPFIALPQTIEIPEPEVIEP